VELALTICLSVPNMGMEMQPTDPMDIRYPNWHLRDLHERYREDKSVWSVERNFGPFAAGMVLGDTKVRDRVERDHDRTLYLYSEVNRFTFLATPDSAGVTYKVEFGGAH
jgi:hypothetical protein